MQLMMILMRTGRTKDVNDATKGDANENDEDK